MTHRICLADPPTSLDRHNRSPAGLSLLRHPFVSWSLLQWCRNINLLSIGYAFRPHLRLRLTLSGLTFLRNPWTYGGQGSHLAFRYLCWQSLFPGLQPCSRSAFTDLRMLSYHPPLARRIHNFGTEVMDSPRKRRMVGKHSQVSEGRAGARLEAWEETLPA